MAAKPSAITPARSALAAPGSGNPLADALASYDPRQFNLATPIVVLDQVPPMHRVSIRVVQIDAESETYQIPGGDKVGLGKTALDKIAAAAGVNWIPERCGQIDTYNDPHRVIYKAVCTIQDFDGRRRLVFAEKEVDLRGEPGWPLEKLGNDAREFVRQAEGKAAFHMTVPADTRPSTCRDCGQQVFWVETKNKKKMPLDPGGDSHFSTCPAKAKLPAGWERVYQQRANIRSLAESKAKLRCIRTAIGLPVSMTPEQAARPFVVPALVPDLDVSDPDIKRMVAASLIGAQEALYGPRPLPSGPLSPAIDPEVIDVSAMEEAPAEPAEPVGEPELPPIDEPPVACGLPINLEWVEEHCPVNDENRYKHLQALAAWCKRAEDKLGTDRAAAIYSKLGGGFTPASASIAEVAAMAAAIKAELPGGGK